MARSHVGVRRRLLVVPLLAAALAAAEAGPTAAADVTGVSGSAYGAYLEMSLFGQSFEVRGPKPNVTLPPQGSGPVTATATGLSINNGPATLFSSGPVEVTTQGTTGPTGSVTSTATIANPNRSDSEAFGEDNWVQRNHGSPPQPRTNKPLTTVSSTCTANAAGASGSTTINNGKMYLDNGFDLDADGDFGVDLNGNGDYTDPDDYVEPGEHPPVIVYAPTNPAPNTSFTGHLHIGSNPDFPADNFRYVFNEQVVNPDGGITVYAIHQYLIGPTGVGDLYVGKVNCSLTPHVAADYTGDGRADYSVYRPSDGSWWVKNGTNAFWGTSGDIPVPGDYNGDGRTDFAVYRPSTGAWYVQGGTDALWGTAGDIPVPADYTGDGKTDIAVYRPSEGAWYVLGGPAAIWGTTGDVPVPADYDGDTKADFAVYRPSSSAWYIAGVDATIRPNAIWGTTGDVPVPGDYTGEGKADVAVYRPSDGTWYVLGGTNAFWGLTGDVPQPGDYDGDGRTEYATYQPSNGLWAASGAPAVGWGLPGDVPLTLPYAIRNVCCSGP